MPENEYLAKIQAAAAEADRKKQDDAAEEERQKVVKTKADKERSIQDSLGKRETSIGTAKQKSEEGQALNTKLAGARTEVQQFDDLAPKVKELGIDAPDFEAKHTEARGRVSDLEGRISATATQEKEASDVVGQTEGNPEVLTRLHGEALKENETLDVQKGLEKKQKYVQEREEGIERLQTEIAELDKAIQGYDQTIQRAELGIKWYGQTKDLNTYKKKVEGVLNDRLRDSQKEEQTVDARLQGLPKKLFGNKDKATLEERLTSVKGQTQKLTELQAGFSRYSAEGSVGVVRDEQFNQSLDEVAGKKPGFSSWDGYDAYKFTRDKIKEISGQMGRQAPEKPETALTTDKKAAETARREKVRRKDELVKFIDYVKKTELPKVRQEIQDLQRRAVAKK